MTETHESSSDVVYGYPQNFPQYIPYPQYDLVPGSPRRRRTRRSCGSCCRISCCGTFSASNFTVTAFLLVSFAAAGFLLFPRQPEVDVKRVTLNKITVHLDEDTYTLLPSVQLDVSLNLLLKVTNFNFFRVIYGKVSVSFSYQGDDLGKVESEGGEIPSRSVVLEMAKLDLLGTKILQHAGDLIADWTNRKVPLGTVTVFSGNVEMFALRPQIKVTVYCNIVVDPVEKEVLSRECSLLPIT